MNVDQPDLWRSQGSPAPIVLWDMLDGPMPRGLLGAGDPNVHLVDDRWTLFVGGFTTTFRNRLFRAHLVDEATGPVGPWRIDRNPRGRARPLAADPPKGSWDAAGMHTPSYVPPAAGNGARIYYSGRANAKLYGPGSRYAIGVLEHVDGQWRRRGAPVLEGSGQRWSVLEPRVVHSGGRYRMWYQANPHEIGPGEHPDYELHCVESEDGLTGWTPPRVFAGPDEGFFDIAIAPRGDRWVMLLARGSDLHNTGGFPPQGLWWSTAAHPSADRADWSRPRRFLDTDAPGTPIWMARGTYGPGLAFDPANPARATVLLTGVRDTPRWPRLMLGRVSRLRRPPVPAPFYLSVASLMLDLPTC
nr:AntQ [Pseudonocardia antarctica]